MKFKILTLFPEAFYSYLDSSIIKRGIQEGKINVELINFREYSKNKHKKVDDNVYGGGPGLLLNVEPLYYALKDNLSENSKLIFLTPEGSTLNQNKVKEFSKYEEIVLVCGHYEGFDARIFKLFENEKISIGDFILTGGELPALVLLDAVSRYKEQLPGSIESLDEESFSSNLLEYEQYTRPAEFLGLKVPEVYLSGNHKLIDEERKKNSLINTYEKRLDLFKKVRLTEKEIEILKNYIKENYREISK